MLPIIELIQYFSTLLAITSVVMLIGIVLRVEQMLDVSLKYFLHTAIILLIAVVVDMLQHAGLVPAWFWNDLFYPLILIFFTAGVWEMRRLIRRLDGEVKAKRQSARKSVGR